MELFELNPSQKKITRTGELRRELMYAAWSARFKTLDEHGNDAENPADSKKAGAQPASGVSPGPGDI